MLDNDKIEAVKLGGLQFIKMYHSIEGSTKNLVCIFFDDEAGVLKTDNTE